MNISSGICNVVHLSLHVSHCHGGSASWSSDSKTGKRHSLYEHFHETLPHETRAAGDEAAGRGRGAIVEFCGALLLGAVEGREGHGSQEEDQTCGAGPECQNLN